jgi:hypothetical protein
MADLICLIPNHGYSESDSVSVSWLNDIFFVRDPSQNSFKISSTDDDLNLVQYTETITDGFVREDNEDAVTEITGLDHLEDETVVVTSGGAFVGTFIVSSGSITLNSPLTTYQVGKNYDSTLKPMDLDIQGTGLATTKRINRIAVNLIDTIGGTIGPDVDHMEDIPTGTAPFTGFKEISIPGGYSRDTDITIKQNLPLPMTVLSITYDLGASND